MSSPESDKDSNLPATPFPSRRQLHGSGASEKSGTDASSDSGAIGAAYPTRSELRRRAAAPNSSSTGETLGGLSTRRVIDEPPTQRELPSRVARHQNSNPAANDSTLPSRQDASSPAAKPSSLIPQRGRPTGTSASVPPIRTRVSRGVNPAGEDRNAAIRPEDTFSRSERSRNTEAARFKQGAQSTDSRMQRSTRHLPAGAGQIPTRQSRSQIDWQNPEQTDPRTIYQTQEPISPNSLNQNYLDQNYSNQNYATQNRVRQNLEQSQLEQNYYQQRQLRQSAPGYTRTSPLDSGSHSRYFDSDQDYSDFTYSDSDSGYPDSNYSRSSVLDSRYSAQFASSTQDWGEDFVEDSQSNHPDTASFELEPDATGSFALSRYHGGSQEMVYAETGDKHRARKRSRVFVWLVLFFALCLLIAGSAFAVVHFFSDDSDVNATTDYEGSGDGTVLITIDEGALGSDIAQVLYDNEVIASVSAFTQVCNSNSLCQTIQPGTYQLAYHMSAAAALEALLNTDNRVSDNAIAVNTGQTVEQIRESFINAGFSETEVDTALADTDALGLPTVAEDNLEGWLASGTYQISSDDTVESLLSEMIDAQVAILQSTGVAESEWMTVLTKASIVEREVAYDEYMPQVARVIENRLDNVGDETGGRLQMDSTVLYGVGKVGGIPTQEDLEDDNPYNTYLYAGLPPTPIAVPSQTAIEAVVNPADGDWLYFVTVNLETGETLFASTLSEQEANVQLFNQYCAENSDMC